MRLKRIVFFSLACALPLAVLGEPGRSPNGSRSSGASGARSGDRNRTGEWGSEREREQFRKDLQVFCEANSPNRWKEIFRSGERNPRIGAMAWQFRSLQALQKDDPKLYEIKVNQIRVQDEEFGILQALKDPEKNPEKLSSEELETRLKEKAEKDVLLRLSERQHRIETLDKLLKKEKDALEADVHDSPKLVEARCKDLIKQGPTLYPTPLPRRNDLRGDTSRPSRADAPAHAN